MKVIAIAKENNSEWVIGETYETFRSSKGKKKLWIVIDKNTNINLHDSTFHKYFKFIE